ncbi:MAG: sensor domain-containing diguanylate cyclase [Myxococcota bacterium]
MWGADILALSGIALAVGLIALAFVLGRRSMEAQTRRLELTISRLDRRAQEFQRRAEDLHERCETSEDMVRRLQRSIVEMPEIAQRLSATRDLREIPERTLDLVQEMYDPSYSVFYRAGSDGLIAVASRGESEFSVGHRVKLEQGIVGWACVKQLAFTAEDAELESNVVKDRHLAHSIPKDGFSLCLPIVSGQTTIGAILIGPSERNLPHLREIGRTIAMITSVCITSAVVLKQQKMLAKTDGLTGLLNKRHLLGLIGEFLAAEGGPREVSLFLFDIDHFKHYNDTNGHLPGDELLKSLSALLKDQIRDGDLVGRYGGEEFLLVMPGAEKGVALRAADRLRAHIAEINFPHRESQPSGRVTVSGGVSTWPLDSDSVEGLIRCADEALYHAKRSGRDRVFAYSPAELVTDDVDPLSGVLDLTVEAEDKEEAPS